MFCLCMFVSVIKKSIISHCRRKNKNNNNNNNNKNNNKKITIIYKCKNQFGTEKIHIICLYVVYGNGTYIGLKDIK